MWFSDQTRHHSLGIRIIENITDYAVDYGLYLKIDLSYMIQ